MKYLSILLISLIFSLGLYAQEDQKTLKWEPEIGFSTGNLGLSATNDNLMPDYYQTIQRGTLYNSFIMLGLKYQINDEFRIHAELGLDDGLEPGQGQMGLVYSLDNTWGFGMVWRFRRLYTGYAEVKEQVQDAYPDFYVNRYDDVDFIPSSFSIGLYHSVSKERRRLETNFSLGVVNPMDKEAGYLLKEEGSNHVIRVDNELRILPGVLAKLEMDISFNIIEKENFNLFVYANPRYSGFFQWIKQEETFYSWTPYEPVVRELNYSKIVTVFDMQFGVGVRF